MATKTRRQLIDQALDALGIIVPGQAPSDEVVSRVDGLLNPILASLEAQDITYVADWGTPSPPTGGAFEEATFLAVADCAAWRSASAFNLGADPALKVKNDLAEEELRRIGRPPRTRRLLTTDVQLRAGVRRYPGFNWSTGL